MASAAGGTSLMATTLAVPVKQPPGGSGSGGGSSGLAGRVVVSPNSLLPTHISVFGDGVTGLDLQHAAAVGRPAATLPSHISEFGGDDECGDTGVMLTLAG
jgi:hypothetical protein